ncbi:hypothetical protein JOC86_000995 [Bacillus pakistanensis]|uniref:Uncharacterized protein n=1 Tax=Rossellomorea pakistanensis TaxID=992288 RepID=A0ABS2N9E5_9BACI|nr:hypothetical protein [Bacillus pakistanensis]
METDYPDDITAMLKQIETNLEERDSGLEAFI